MTRSHRVSSMARIAVAAVLLAAPATADIQGTNWFPIGPAPIDGFFAGGVSGRASAIAVNPANASEIWVGTAAGGVWHTIDDGLNWEPLSDKEDALAIGALAVDGCTAAGCAVLYAGTGENAIRRDTIYGAGLIIGGSSGGEIDIFSWTQRTGNPFDFRQASINNVVLDPNTSGASKRIFVTLSSGVTVAAPESTVTAPAPAGGYGIYRSDDQGVSWSAVSVAGAAGARPTDLKMRPGDPQVLYAGFAGRGVFKSTNGGGTWCPLNAGIPQPAGCPTQTLPDIGILTFDHVKIAIAPSNNDVVYASFGRCPDKLLQSCQPAIWRTQDGGTTWTERTAAATGFGYSRYTHALAVDPANANTLLLGGIALWRSVDGGATFTISDANFAAGPGLNSVHSDHREVLFHPVATTRAYTTGDGGLATSSNGGVNWTPRNEDLQITGFHGIGSSPLTGAVIGTSQDNGGQLWNGSRRWTHLKCCGDGGYSFLDRDDVMTLYAASNFGAPTRSTNGGVSFTSISAGIPTTDPRLFYAPFIQDPSPASNGQHPLYFGSNRLFQSLNNGDMWTAVSPVLATGTFADIVTAASVPAHVAAGTGQNVISAIAVAPSNPNRVYVGYYGGEVFRSNPSPCVNPNCWRAISSGLPVAPVSRIAVHPTNMNIAYITFSGFGPFARVWKTTNGGMAWNAVVSGLPPGIPANTVSIEPSVPEKVYVGLDSGPDGASVYRSTNGGGAWTAFADSLPNAPVFEISIDEVHGRMYAATHGRGAWVLGKPFISNFEGWVHDSIWDIPVYGQNFLPNQACTMQVLQSNGDVCATASVDVMGGTIRTDSGGVLETSLASMWSGKKVVWACFNGSCLGGTPIANCYDDADGDGDRDPLSTIVVACGGQIATGKVVGCPPLANPPSTVVELGLSGLPGGPGPGPVTASAVGELTEVFHLVASVQRRVGTESICAVAVPFRRRESEEAVLTRARDAIAASPTCAANRVQAVLDLGRPGPSEDEFGYPPRLLLQAPGIVGGQLVTVLHADPGRATGACMRLSGLGVPILNQIHVLKVDLLTPPGGAAGGTITLVEHSPIGTCAITIPTTPGQTKADLAAAVAAAVQAPGIPGPHPGCPAANNPRDITNHAGSLISVYASSIEICSNDAKVGFDLRSEELTNVHPIADAGGDRVLPVGGAVALDASRSSDPDSTPGTHDNLATFEWFDVSSATPIALGSGKTLSVPLAEGLHRIRLRVTDTGGLSDTNDVLVSLAEGADIVDPPGRVRSSFHVGSAHPLGGLSTQADANVHVRGDVGLGLNPRFRLQLSAGLSQFTAEASAAVAHQRWIDVSLNGQAIVPLAAGMAFYLQGGPGIYWPKTGSSDFGFNLGAGFRLRISTNRRLELGMDYHRIPAAHAHFVTLALGVVF